ncbi:hypothetical protein [Microbulbifer sp. THAF38]|uniref:hypothetical protein n=1 Tax=Microbulbifer sp. THAF38 TaxID=2587856 RepID=UPI0012680DE7|nr:hypothetical protein [Microbulbifer sp. THAF38]QFT55049.1 hypothetical protein FIU95_10825 [Microbulbifer sp. THAF38]
MPNLVRSRNNATSCNDMLGDLSAALGVTQANMRCIGVMIQAGKTLTSFSNIKKTIGGGHVSPFVVNANGLQSWDEICGNSWQVWAQNSASGETHGTVNNVMFYPSSANDVTIYVHPASDTEVATVVNRAQQLLNSTSLVYNHNPTLTSNFPTSGDCVTKSAWVMGAFSYSKPMQGAVTPWGQAVIYEAYTSPVNFMSKWVKIKNKGCKLGVMN